jgi:hypothetical protein
MVALSSEDSPPRPDRSAKGVAIVLESPAAKEVVGADVRERAAVAAPGRADAAEDQASVIGREERNDVIR